MSDSSGKREKKPTSVRTLMQANTPNGETRRSRDSADSFTRMLSHARVLNRLDDMLATMLEPGLSLYCQVAEFRDHHLILLCPNASFATRIRMLSQQLLDTFAKEGVPGIERIEVRIAPVNRPRPEVRNRRTLSSAAVQALGRFATDSGDAKIQAIFEKISARRNE